MLEAYNKGVEMNLHQILFPNDPHEIPKCESVKRITYGTIIDRDEERCAGRVFSTGERIVMKGRDTAYTYAVTERNRDLPCRCGSRRFISPDGKCRTTMCKQCQDRKNADRKEKRKVKLPNK